MTISVIIPVFNEERTIASVIEIVKSWGKACEIIVVNDGSTDETLKAIAQFTSDIVLLSEKENHGKGYAMAKGIEKSKGDVLLFLDGDLLGLTRKHLDDLVAPVVSETADMTVRTHEQERFKKSFDILRGDRALRRADVLPLIIQMKSVGYGIELLLTNHYKNKQVTYVDLPFVTSLLKYEKQPMNEAVLSYIKEARELVTQAVRQQAGGLTPPQAKRLFTMIALYLKQALDYM